MQPWCTTCGSTDRLSVDHIIPAALRPDLAYETTNLQVLCLTCNGRKDGATRGGTPGKAQSSPLVKAQRALHTTRRSR
ncbi:HNH endonuclease [Skermania sp. ID1734]|uniref:HNH endonuclease n=1 Tax=Skermania sp. ID1734 TaxID=2597516 RepID=UPI00117F9867